MNIKVWKDKDGYAFKTEDPEFELTDEAFDMLLDELRELQDEELDEGDEGTMRDIFLDLPEGK